MINRDIIPVIKNWKRKQLIKDSVICLFVIGMIFVAYSCSKEKDVKCLPSHPAKVIGSNSQRWHRFVAYFIKKGSRTPELMATAVLETKRPKLMAAIAVKESRGNLRALGDGKKSKGAFQVQAKHWKNLLHEKKVSRDAITQALDSERILEALLEENNGNIKKALNAYNGDRTKKVYAKNILAELANIP